MNAEHLARLQADPVAFRDALRLEDGRPWIRDPWQEEFFLATDPGWQRAIGRDVAGGFSRAWATRHRGASKTSDEAAMVCYGLFGADGPRRGAVGAGKQDQARLLSEAVTRWCNGAEWLKPFIVVQRDKIINPHNGAECAILTSDAPTSMGLLLDFCVADELTTWPNLELWYSLFSAVGKKRNAFLAVLSNTGHLESPQAELWAKLQGDPAWFTHSPDEMASWISPATVDEQRRILPAVVFARLWQNIWTLNESGAVPPDQLDRSICLAGPMHGRTDLTAFVAGVDLAIKADRAAVVVLNFDGSGMVRLARAQSWHPSQFPNRQIPQSAVEEAVRQAHRDFYLEAAIFDPAAGGYAMCQRLEADGLKCVPYMFTVANCDMMARCLLTAFAESRIQLYPHSELISDIGKLTLAELPTGWRLRAPRSATGHADLAVSLSIALPHAMTWSNEIAQGGNYQERLPEHVQRKVLAPTKKVHNPYRGVSIQEMMSGGGQVHISGPGADVLRQQLGRQF